MKRFALLSLLALAGCKATQKPVAHYLPEANRLAQKYAIADGHVDLPYRLKVKNFRMERQYVGIPVESKDGDFDYVRARKGGLDAPFMSIYIPSYYSPQGGRALADSLINMVEFIARENPTKFMIARSPADVMKAKSEEKIALPMGMENGSPIAKVEDVAYFKQRGISYVTLTHAKANHICDSSYDSTRLWNGLSPFGYNVVAEMVRQGVMIDISHVSDSTFWDVVRISPVPVIASHSSARKFTPGFERNMADDMIREMKRNGGVIMVNFGSNFVDGTVKPRNQEAQKRLNALLKEKGLDEDSEAGQALELEFKKANPWLYADIEQVADHIDHIVKLAGIEHVGFGSDFDGVGDSLPTGLKDVSDYPNLLAVLLRRGYAEADIEKICSGNIFRVWNTVLNYAKEPIKTGVH